MRKRILTIGIIVLVCVVALTVFYFAGGLQLLCKHERQMLLNAQEVSCIEMGYSGDLHCNDCGKLLQKGEEIPWIEHTPAVRDAVEATCTEWGWTGETYCQVCNSLLHVSVETEPKGHNEVAKGRVEATCTTAGNTGEITCGDCGIHIQEGEVVDALGHKEVTENYKANTCTTDGYSGDTHCSVCNTTLKKGKTIPAAHDVVIKNQKDATCSAEGYSGDKSCKVCGVEISKGKVVGKTGHSSATRNQKAATCITDGYSGDTYCSVCKADLTTGKTIPATNHKNLEDRNQKAATETEEGYTGDSYCKDCDTLIKKGEVIAKLTPIPNYQCVSSVENSVFAEINANRKEHGLHELKLDNTIHSAVHIRANEFVYREINKINVGPHNRLDGSPYDTVLEEMGLFYSITAEIIVGAINPNGLVPAWMASTAGHREAILDKDFTHISVCVVFVEDTYFAVAIFHNNVKYQ